MPTTGLNPYNLNKLLGGPARVLWAASTVARPTKLTDVIATDDGIYAPKTGWNDFGATTGPFNYGRQIDEAGYTIEQDTGEVIKEVTQTMRTAQVQIGEIKQAHLQILEEGSTASVSSGAHQSAESQVKFGSIFQLSRYRLAFIGRRAKGIGSDVTETANSSNVRGAFVGAFLYLVSIQAEQSQVTLGKGSLATVPITFESFPESSLTQGQEYGLWTEESAGTISPT